MVQSLQGILHLKIPAESNKIKRSSSLHCSFFLFFDPHLRVRLFEKIPAGRKNCRHNAD